MHPEDEIADILASWREQYGQADGADPEEVIRRNPQHAEALRAHFEALRIAEQALRVSEPGPTPVADGELEAPLRPIAADKYVGFDPVGQGGMGIVYWAVDTDLNREVAFKVVRPFRDESESQVPDEPGAITPPDKDTPASKAFATLRRRFLREATVTGRLEHPGVVPVYEVGETGEGVPYFTMRFIHGRRTFADAIEELSDEPLEIRLKLLDPFIRVCDTIHYAHSRGVIHRDLKPENIALGEFGEVVVIDWGLARIQALSDPADPRWQEHLRAYHESPDMGTLTGIVGTPGYIAPEALLGKQTDERSDVYALGVLLFQILTGRMPYEFTSPAEFYAHVSRDPAPKPVDLIPDVARALSDLCTACLDKDREARPPTAAALVDTIRAWRASHERDRETETLLREARALYAASEGLEGDALLRQLARASVPLGRVFEHRPGESSALRLMARLEERHAQAVQEHAVATTKRHMRRAGLVALVLAAVAALVGALFFREEQQDAEQAREAARGALARVRSLALVNASREAAERDPLLALMLARDAVRANSSATSVSHLHEAILAHRPYIGLQGHEGVVRFAFFSPDGRHVLTSSGDGTARLWDESGKQLQVYGSEGIGIHHAQFSPDGDRILAGCRDGTARIWTLDGRAVTVLRGHEGPVNMASFSPDGTQVVTPGNDGLVRVWSLDGRVRAVLRGHEGSVYWACFSPDGTRILTSAFDGTARLWTLAGKQLTKMPVAHGYMSAKFWLDGTGILTASRQEDDCYWDLEGKGYGANTDHADDLTWLEASPCGRYLVSASQDGTALIADTEKGGQVRLRGHEWIVFWATVAPGGAHVLTSGMDGTARLWNRAGRQLAILSHHVDGFWLGCFSPDGRQVVVASGGEDPPKVAGQEARIYDVRTPEVAVLGDHSQPLTWGCISPDGIHVLAVAENRIAYIWDRRGRVHAKLTALAAGREGRWPAFSPDGRRILVINGSGRVSLLDRDASEVLDLAEPIRYVDSAAFVHDGRLVRVDDHSGRVTFWTLEGRRLPGPQGYEADVQYGVAFNQERYLASCTAEGTVLIWEPDGRVHVELQGQEPRACAVDLLPEAGAVVTATRDGTVRLWGLDGTLTGSFHAHEGELREASFARGGQRIVTRSADGSTCIWDREGREILALRGGPGWLWGNARSPDGARIANRSEDGVVRLWDLDGRELGILREAVGGTAGPDPFAEDVSSCLSFEASGDGKHLVSVCNDGVVRLWDVNGREVAEFGGHTEEITHAGFSPDGRMILTCSMDGIARVWLVYTEDLLELVDGRIPRTYTPAERELYGELLLEPREPAGAQR